MIQLNAINQQKDDDSDKTDKTTQSTRNQLAVALLALKLLQEQQALDTATATNPVTCKTTNRPQDKPLLAEQAHIAAMEVDATPPENNNTAPAPATPTDIETGDVGHQN
jgi:threonine aldolase